MTEIDFDELDKAVSTLMGDKAVPQPKTDEKSDEPTPETRESVPNEADQMDGGDETIMPTEESESPAESDDISEVSADDATPESTPPSEETPATHPARPAAIATKRRGQFMDVMHPSANMKQAASRAPSAVSQISRHGITLAPPRDLALTSPTPPPRPTPVAESSSSIEPPSSPDWPDPIDLAESDEPALPASPALEPEITLLPESTTTPPTPQAPAEPLVSPFLPDAKVEKRPLGEPQPTGLSETSAESDSAATSETAPLPAELSGGVLAVESSELVVETKPSAPEAPAPVKSETREMSVPTSRESVGPASIPPQYTTTDTADDTDEHSALYDTVSSAHTTTSEKKRSGWLVPVAIIGLIILGCGGGVLVYYYFL